MFLEGSLKPSFADDMELLWEFSPSFCCSSLIFSFCPSTCEARELFSSVSSTIRLSFSAIWRCLIAMLDYMSITTNSQALFSEKGVHGMKLKDKKIDIVQSEHVSDKYGNRENGEKTVATVWAYFRQLPGDELYTGVSTQTNETCLFQIGFLDDLNTKTQAIKYNGNLYDITRVDTFEGYKTDLTLYCKIRKQACKELCPSLEYFIPRLVEPLMK